MSRLSCAERQRVNRLEVVLRHIVASYSSCRGHVRRGRSCAGRRRAAGTAAQSSAKRCLRPDSASLAAQGELRATVDAWAGVTKAAPRRSLFHFERALRRLAPCCGRSTRTIGDAARCDELLPGEIADRGPGGVWLVEDADLTQCSDSMSAS